MDCVKHAEEFRKREAGSGISGGSIPSQHAGPAPIKTWLVSVFDGTSECHPRLSEGWSIYIFLYRMSARYQQTYQLCFQAYDQEDV
jgi:hypothetical protein